MQCSVANSYCIGRVSIIFQFIMSWNTNVWMVWMAQIKFDIGREFQKNFWMSDKSWEPELSLSLTLSHSLTHSLTHSLFHSYFLIHSLSACWTTFVFMSMLKSHSLTFTLSHSHTLALSHSFNLSFTLSTCWTSFVFISMLKTHCFGRKLQWNIWGHPHPLLLH